MNSRLGRETLAGERRCSRLAIAVCVISAALAVAAIYGGWWPLVQVLMLLSVTWNFTANWLNRGGGGGGLLGMTTTQIYQRAREGRLYRSSLARTIATGSLLLAIASVACFVKSA
jgi:hypothetical protein